MACAFSPTKPCFVRARIWLQIRCAPDLWKIRKKQMLQLRNKAEAHNIWWYWHPFACRFLHVCKTVLSLFTAIFNLIILLSPALSSRSVTAELSRKKVVDTELRRGFIVLCTNILDIVVERIRLTAITHCRQELKRTMAILKDVEGSESSLQWTYRSDRILCRLCKFLSRPVSEWNYLRQNILPFELFDQYTVSMCANEKGTTFYLIKSTNQWPIVRDNSVAQYPNLELQVCNMRAPPEFWGNGCMMPRFWYTALAPNLIVLKRHV